MQRLYAICMLVSCVCSSGIYSVSFTDIACAARGLPRTHMLCAPRSDQSVLISCLPRTISCPSFFSHSLIHAPVQRTPSLSFFMVLIPVIACVWHPTWLIRMCARDRHTRMLTSIAFALTVVGLGIESMMPFLNDDSRTFRYDVLPTVVAFWYVTEQLLAVWHEVHTRS